MQLLMLAKFYFIHVHCSLGAVGIGIHYVAVVRATPGSAALRPPKNRAAKPCISRSPSAVAASLSHSGAGSVLWQQKPIRFLKPYRFERNEVRRLRRAVKKIL